MNEQTNEIICEICEHNVSRHDEDGCCVGRCDCDMDPRTIVMANQSSEILDLQNALAALQSTNEGQAETIRQFLGLIEKLEGVACGAVNHVAIANYPERQVESIRQIEVAFDAARTLLASTTPKDGQG